MTSFQIDNKWYCRNETDCLPWTDGNDVGKVFETQNLCRLMCGRLGGLWPRPIICNIDKSTIDINVNQIRFEYPDNVNNEFYDQITFLFLKNLNDECGTMCNAPSENELFIRMNVNNPSLSLNAKTNESYQLNISSTTETKILANVNAETPFGLRHALETLSQLMTRIIDGNDRIGLVMISKAFIADKPFYQHRGLLIDSARHFLPTSTILKILDGMSVNKMNVLHWHITDSQSFPMESKRLPQMHKTGAFSIDKFYRQNEINDIVKYAKYRGIRVIFELDAPSHAGHGWEWGENYGLGKLSVCVDKQPWRKFCIQPNCGQLNPANENVYTALRDIYSDINDYMEKGEYFHMGGDEVFMPCWNQTEEIVDYMKKKNYDRTTEGFLKLWSEFQGKALKKWDEISGGNSSSIILWSSELTLPDDIEKYLSKDRYIIQTWIPSESPIPVQLLKKGYRIVMSTKNAWYFDHGFWGNTKYYNWKTVYANTLPKSYLVLGGEVCMWGVSQLN